MRKHADTSGPVKIALLGSLLILTIYAQQQPAAMPKPASQKRTVDFQREIRPFYGSTDLQVVGSTEATGLRTRIVESFAYQVPVLSTGVGAEGVEGLEPGRNILLADDPAAFASEIEALIRQPSRLAEIASAGRKTYSSLYSRGAVALRLQFLLSQYLAS